MKRSSFLKVPLLAIPLSLEAQAQIQDRPKRGFKVQSGNDRFNKPTNVADKSAFCKVSGKDTGSDMLIYEERHTKKGGPPLHVHKKQDEWFYVLEGEFIIKVGEDTFHCKPGDSVFAPRKVPHSHARKGEGPFKKLSIFQPAGRMEEFHEKSSGISNKPPEEIKRFFHSYGMDIVGPRLTIE